MSTLVDRKSNSCKILQDSCKLGKSCKILTESSFLARFSDAMAFLQDSCKILAKKLCSSTRILQKMRLVALKT